MDFASKYGYNYGHSGSDEEEVSDEEVETKQKVKRKIRKIDTNVVSAKFDQLVLANEMHAGDPIMCQKCSAIMTELCKTSLEINDNETAGPNSGKKIWTCEFCYEKNDITSKLTSLDEIPKQNDVTFLIEPAPSKQANQGGEASTSTKATSLDDNYLLFCIDVSGSMDTLIPLRNSASDSNEIDSSSPSSFSSSAANRADSNMTRLQGVKTACVENLKNLKDNEPNKRVGLVTFSDRVKYFGDGTKCQNNQPLVEVGDNFRPTYGGYGQQMHQQPRPPRNIFNRLANNIRALTSSATSSTHSPAAAATTTTTDDDASTAAESTAAEEEEQQQPADLMTNKEKLIAFANNQKGDLMSINETHMNLEQRLKLLRTEGSTALGPALTFCVGFSSKKAGSQIILCTDGCANVGMGSIENGNKAVAEKFYEDLADYAKSTGVTVNVITMEGTDCKIALLGKVADRSNGSINIVNPANLADQFKSILENRIVATNVKAKLIVNLKYLYIRDEALDVAEGKAIEANDEEAKERLNAEKKSIIEKDVGNANIDTEITFEYGVRKLADGEKEKAEKFTKLPFQLQISYTTTDGAKAIRVYSKYQEFTTERQAAESSVISDDIVWTHNCQKMSNLMVQNNVSVAKFRNQQNQHYMSRNDKEAPAVYSKRAALVQIASKSSRLEDLDDQAAEELYAGSKFSRNKLAKGSK